MTGLFDDLIPGAKPRAVGVGMFGDLIPAKSKGDFSRGWGEAWDQLPQLGYGLLAGAGAVAENVVGEGGIATGIKKAGVAGYTERSEKIAAGSKESDSWSHSYDQAKAGDFGSLVDWLQHGLGYVTGQGVQMLATAGIGAVGGKMVLGTAAKQIASGMVAKETAALTAANAGGKLTAEQIAAQATANVASKIGQTSAIGASALGMEGGEIFGGLTQQAEKDGRQLTGAELGKAFAATLAAGGLEFVGDKIGLDILLGKSRLLKPAEHLGDGGGMLANVGGRLARGAVAATGAAPIEGATEYAQTLIEEYGKGNDAFSQESLAQAKDAAALGALGGTVIGGVGGGIRGAKPKADPVREVLAAPSVDNAIGAATAAISAPAAPALKPRQANAAAADELAMLDPADRAEALSLMQMAERQDVSGNVRRYAQNRLDELLAPVRQIPTGEVSEVLDAPLPTGEATELDMGELSDRLGRPSFTQRRMLERGIPAGEATEPTPDERIAAAAAQAPKREVLPTDILTGDGVPYGSKTAANVRAVKEGLTPASVIEIPGAGWVVRPKEAPSVTQPETFPVVQSGSNGLPSKNGNAQSTYARQPFVRNMERDQEPLLQREGGGLQELRRQGDQDGARMGKGLQGVRGSGRPATDAQSLPGPDRQQQRLRAGKYEVGHQEGAVPEPEKQQAPDGWVRDAPNVGVRGEIQNQSFGGLQEATKGVVSREGADGATSRRGSGERRADADSQRANNDDLPVGGGNRLDQANDSRAAEKRVVNSADAGDTKGSLTPGATVTLAGKSYTVKDAKPSAVILTRQKEDGGTESRVIKAGTDNWNAIQGGANEVANTQPNSGGVAATGIAATSQPAAQEPNAQPTHAISERIKERPQTIDTNVVSGESLLNTLRADAELLGRISQAKPAGDKLLGDLDVESKRVVLSAVSRLVKNDEIFKRIVELVPVDVMNVLAGNSIGTKGSSDYRSVLKNVASLDAERPIPILVEAADTLVRVAANAAAEKLAISDLAGGAALERNSALSAADSVGGAITPSVLASPATEKDSGLGTSNAVVGTENGAAAMATLEGRQVNSPTRIDELGSSSGATNDGPTTVRASSKSDKPAVSAPDAKPLTAKAQAVKDKLAGKVKPLDELAKKLDGAGMLAKPIMSGSRRVLRVVNTSKANSALSIVPDGDGFKVVLDNDMAGGLREKIAARLAEMSAGNVAADIAPTATHKDPGEPAEAVTPAVVREAIKTGVQATDRKPSAMKAELLAEIDAAVQDAPDYGDFQALVKTLNLKDATSLYTIVGKGAMGEKAAPPKYSRPTRTFRVEGDGVFTVNNTVRQLLTFRAKVESSPGFRDRQAQAGLNERATDALDRRSADAAIGNMIEEGDFQAALDFAEAKGVDIGAVKLTKLLRDRLEKWQKDQASAKAVADYEAARAEGKPAPGSLAAAFAEKNAGAAPAPAAEPTPAAQEPAGRDEQPPAEQAAAILNAAAEPPKGKERLDVLKDVKAGAITPEEVAAAFPPAGEVAAVEPVAESAPAQAAAEPTTKPDAAPTEPAPMPAVGGISMSLAQQAHAGTSHVPERRAEQERASFNGALRDAWDRAAQIAGTDPAAIERITEVFTDVADGYRARYTAALQARSRIMSTMIAGGGNFPVARMEKRNATERKRAEEASEYLARGIKRLIRAARGPIDNSPESELERVRLNLAQREEAQEQMVAANAALRKDDDAALEDLGFTAEQIADLKKGSKWDRGFPSYRLSNNSAEIRRLRERLKSAEERMQDAAAGPVETERAGVKIVEDATDDRLRLIFDGKPSEEVREDLKANGFKWSPKNEAWQRQLTDNARRAAKQVLDKHYPQTREDDAGNVAMFSRASGVAKDVANAWRILSENDEVFTYAKSDSTDFAEIANGTGAIFAEPEPGRVGADVERAWRVYPIDENGNPEKGKPAYVIHYKNGTVQLTIKNFSEGSDGSAVYAAVGNYAFNSGIVFEPDGFGLTQAAIERRLENVISLALKFGSTDFIRLSPNQLKAFKMKWRDGDTAFNTEQMLMASYNALAAKFPEIKDYTYDLETGARKSDVGAVGRDEPGTEGIVARARATGARAGERTVARAIFTNTFASEPTGKARRELVRRLGDGGGETLGNNALAKSLYSRAPDARVDLEDANDQSTAASVNSGTMLSDDGLDAVRGADGEGLSGVRGLRDRGRRNAEAAFSGGEFEGAAAQRGFGQSARNQPGRLNARTGVPIADAEAVADAIRAAYPTGPQIVVLDDVRKSPEALLDQIRAVQAANTVEGAYYKGKIYLFPQNVADIQRLMFVGAHHEIRHAGLDALFGKRKGALLLSIAMSNPKVAEAARAKMAEGVADSMIAGTEEALADMPLEDMAKLNGWNKIVAAVRQWLRGMADRLQRNHPKLAAMIRPDEWTDNDVAALIRRAEDISRGGTVPARPGGAVFSDQDSPDWYSALAEQTSKASMNAGPASAWKAMLKNWISTGKVKADEVEWSGLNEWLDMSPGKITKEQVAGYLRANGVQVTETVLGAPDYSEVEAWWGDEGGANEETPFGDLTAQEQADAAERYAEEVGRYEEGERQAPKYANYTLPGGTNYREVLLTLPGKSSGKYWAEDAGTVPGYPNWMVASKRESDGETLYHGKSHATREAAERAIAELDGTKLYKSGHWDQPNIVAHIRVNDRVGADGSRVLFVEELQSDYAQDARKKGIQKKPETVESLDDPRVRLERRLEDGKELTDVYLYGENIQTWKGNIPADYILSDLNEVIEKRAKKGVPAAPYIGATDKWVALAMKRVIKMAVDGGYDRVAFVTGEQSADRYDLSKQVEAIKWRKTPSGMKGWVSVEMQTRGSRAFLESGPHKEGDLADVVGKELAERILQSQEKEGEIRGVDLKVGGEGMRAFYNKIVPSVAKDVLRKLGGGAMETVDIGGAVSGRVQDRQNPDYKPLEQPGFTITQGMKDKALGGMPLFSRADQTQTPARPEAARAVDTGKRSPLTGKPLIDVLDADGNRIETSHIAKTTAEALENYRQRPARQAAARAAAPAPTYAMPEKAAKAEGSNWRRVQGQKFTALDEDDAYLYHVTSAPAASGVREQGLVPNAGGMFGGFYANYSAGKVFLTERSGVSYWQEKVGQQLKAAMDNPPAVTVLRIPKDKIKAKLQPDTVGSGDSGAPAFYSNEAVFSRAGTAKTTAPDWITSGSAALQGAAGKIDTYAPQKTMAEKAREMSAGWKQKMVQGMFDAYAPLKALSMDAYIAARMTKAADGAFEGMLMYGKPKMTADGGIIGDLDGKGFLGAMRELNGEHDRFFMWLAGNRAERLLKEGKENLFTADEIAAMKALNSGTMPDGRLRVAAYKRTLDEFNLYSKSVLDVAEQAGLIDGESRKLWEHDFYVPFYRMSQENEISGPTKIKGLVRQKAFERLKGGKENLGDLMDNTLRNWSHLLSASLANVAASKSLLAAEQAGIAIEAKEDQAKEMAKAMGIKGNATYFMDQGLQRWFVIEDPAVLQAVSALEAPALNGLPLQIMGKFKKYLTIGVTIAPAFKVRNLIRDTLAAPAANEMSYNIAKNLAQGWKATDTKTNGYAQMLFSGGLMRFGTYLEGDRAEHVKRLIADGVDDKTILNTPQKVKAMLGKAWDAWQDFGDRMENVNRTALYQQLLDKGLTPREAAFQARDMMDFSLQGSWAAMRTLTAVVPFLNARAQGLYRLGRAASDNPKRMGYMVGAVSLASIALMLAYGDDDDWKAREDWDRDAWWWFKIGETAYRIPKPFELGAMGTIAERSLELMIDDEMTGARFAERMKQMVTGTFAINPVPQLFKPMLDLYANKDSFTGRQIETLGMERLSKAERYGPNTSALAKALGSAGDYTGVSPVQVDHMIRAYFGWLGTMGAATVDVAAGPFSDIEKPAKKMDDYFGGFVKELPAATSRYVEDFYEQAQATSEAMADLRRAREVGDTEKAAEIMEERGDKVALYRMYQHAQRQLADINKRIRLVRGSDSMDAETKRLRLDELTELRNQLARRVSNQTRAREAALQ